MQNETAQLVRVFDALADPTRLRIVELLGRSPRRPGELARSLGTAPSAVSKHLRVLREAGVADDERTADDARARVFRLHSGSVVAARAWLDQLQAHWDQQLASYEVHVRRRPQR